MPLTLPNNIPGTPNIPNLPKHLSIGLSAQKQKPHVPLFEVGLLIIVCGLFTWFMILPKNADLETKRGALSKLKDEQAKISDSLNKLKKLVANMETNQKQIADLDYALPLEGKVTHLQALIENLAQSVGVTVGDVNVTNRGDIIWAGDRQLINNPFGATRAVQKLSGGIYVLGSMDQLIAFLKKVESSARIIDVSAMSLDPGPEGSLGMRLTIDAYYLSPY